MSEPRPADRDGSTNDVEEESWSELDPMTRFGVRVAVVLFCGAVLVAIVSALVAILA